MIFMEEWLHWVMEVRVTVIKVAILGGVMCEWKISAG